MLLASSRPTELSRSRPIPRKDSLSPDDVLAGIPADPTSVAEAFDCLAEVGARLRKKGDPRAAFTDVYAVITRRVRDSILDEARCPFVEPRFISKLAGRFCALYLAALRRSLHDAPEPSAAWSLAHRPDRARRPAIASARRTLPVQHAMLGLNAHINYDLAHGLFGNIRALGGARDPEIMARYRHDHDAVNQILEDAMPEVLELLSERHACPVAHLILGAGELRRALCGATLFTLRVWRTRVWDDLVALIEAPDLVARARITSRMNMRSALFALVLGVPVPTLPTLPALPAEPLFAVA